MYLPEIILSAIIALAIVLLLIPVGGYRTRSADAGIGITMLFFFLLIAPLLWAASVWTPAVGPVIMDVAWMPIFLTAIVVGLLLAAVLPHKSNHAHLSNEPRQVDRSDQGVVDKEAIHEEEKAAATGVAAVFGFFFVALLVAAIVIAVAGSNYTGF